MSDPLDIAYAEGWNAVCAAFLKANTAAVGVELAVNAAWNADGLAVAGQAPCYGQDIVVAEGAKLHGIVGV